MAHEVRTTCDRCGAHVATEKIGVLPPGYRRLVRVAAHGEEQQWYDLCSPCLTLFERDFMSSAAPSATEDGS